MMLLVWLGPGSSILKITEYRYSENIQRKAGNFVSFDKSFEAFGSYYSFVFLSSFDPNSVSAQ